MRQVVNEMFAELNSEDLTDCARIGFINRRRNNDIARNALQTSGSGTSQLYSLHSKEVNVFIAEVQKAVLRILTSRNVKLCMLFQLIAIHDSSLHPCNLFLSMSVLHRHIGSKGANRDEIYATINKGLAF